MTPKAGEHRVFRTPYEQYRDRRGQTCRVLGVIDPATYDSAECGPMYRIEFDDSIVIEAWPEEIDPGATWWSR